MKKLYSRAEYEEMVKGLPEGDCPFCHEDKQIVLGSSQYFFWVASLSPYWRYHTMFIPKRHIEDIAQMSTEEFEDFKELYLRVKDHILSLKLIHTDGKPIDQFILMERIREEGIPGGSTYHKPMHLHLHFVPDREGVNRFNLDATAVDVDIETLSLK